MAYRVLAANAAQRDIRRLPPGTKPRIGAAISGLAGEPRSTAQKLAAEGAYRARAGDYRIVFRIDDRAAEALVVRVKHRRQVNRRRG